MTQVIKCREVGFDCSGVIRAATEEEALEMAAEHAKTAHGVKEITPEMVAKVRAVMKSE